MGDVDIFGDHRADRHVGAGDQLIGAGAKDRAHRPVEPLERPAFGQALGDQRVDLGAPRVGAGDDIVEEVALGVMIMRVLDHRAEPMVVEFLEQARDRRALHLLLVERLDGGEPGGGARTGAGLGHRLGHVAAALSRKEGHERGGDLRRPLPTARSGRRRQARTTVRSSTISSSPSSWIGSRARVLHPPDDEGRDADLGEGLQQPVGQRAP